MKEPATYKEAEQRRLELTAEISQCQTTLGDRSERRRYPRGPAGSAEYQSWRRSIQQDMEAKLVELRQLKSWLASNHYKRGGESTPTVRSINVDDPENLLRHASNLLHTLVRDGCELAADEQAIVDAIDAYLARNRPA